MWPTSTKDFRNIQKARIINFVAVVVILIRFFFLVVLHKPMFCNNRIWHMVVIWLERTVLSIPVAALIAHLLFPS